MTKLQSYDHSKRIIQKTIQELVDETLDIETVYFALKACCDVVMDTIKDEYIRLYESENKKLVEQLNSPEPE